MKLTISENIRKYRRDRGLSQEQVADTFGVSVQSVSRWETGATYPDMELLPAIAGFFGVTVDEMLGVSGALREERLEKYRTEALGLPHGSDRRIAVLRQACAEFPNEWELACWLCEEIGDKPECLNEMRRLVYDAVKQCPDTFYRGVMTYELAMAEEEDKIYDFVEQYITKTPRRLVDMMADRYEKRGEWDKFLLFQRREAVFRIRDMFRIYTNRYAEDPSPERSYATRLAALHYLNAYSGVNEDVSRVNPISGDGVPDMWLLMRRHLGLRLAHTLSGMKRYDEALDAMEELISLYETFFSLPDGSIITYRHDPEGYLNCSLQYGEMNIGGRDVRTAELTSVRNDGIEAIAGESVVYSPYDCLSALTAVNGWEWFNPIREHPRFRVCVDRLRKLSETK